MKNEKLDKIEHIQKQLKNRKLEKSKKRKGKNKTSKIETPKIEKTKSLKNVSRQIDKSKHRKV